MISDFLVNSASVPWTPGEKIALARQKKGPKGWSQTDLASVLAENRALGLDAKRWRHRIANYESNRPAPPENALRFIAEALNVTYSWFLDESNPIPIWRGTGPDEHVVGEPVRVASAGKSLMIYAGEVPCSTAWGNPLEATEPIFVDADFAEVGDYVCRVVNDSLYPALMEGDLTIWKYDVRPPYGCIVLAQRKGDHSCTAKVLAYDKDLHASRLMPLNPLTPPPDDGDGWGVIARLVGVERQSLDGPKRKWIFGPGLRPKHLIEG